MTTTALKRQWLEILPTAMSFFIAALIIYAFDLAHSAVALILGVIAGGIVELDHRLSGRLKQLVITLCCFAFSSLAIQLSISHSLAIICVLSLLALVLPMLGAIDSRYRVFAFGTLTVAVYTTLTYAPDLPWYVNPSMILLGALIFQSVHTISHIFLPNRPVQEALAQVFQTLGDYVQTKALFFAPDERDALEDSQYKLATRTQNVTNAFNHCRDVLMVRLSGQSTVLRSRRQLRDFLIAQDIHERISAAHVDYQELAHKLSHSDVIFRIERLITLQGKASKDYSQALLEESHYQLSGVVRRAARGLKNAWQLYLSAHPDDAERQDITHLIENLLAINKQLSALGEDVATTAPLDTALSNNNVTNFRSVVARLKSNLTLESPFFRHALRQGLLALVSSILVESLHLPLGYWIYLTVLFVCQPNFLTTYSRVYQRIIGTILGVIIGAFLPEIASDKITLLALLVVCNTLFFYFRSRNYSFSTLFITVQVFLGFALIGYNTHDLLASRMLDTLVGSGMALFALYFLWPDWKYVSLQKYTYRALESNARYLRLIIHQLQQHAEDDLSYRAARRRVHEAASELANLVSMMNRNPKKFGHLVKIGYQITQLNYRLVAQISALAAYRGQFSDSEVNTTAQTQAVATLLQGLAHHQQTPPDWAQIRANLTAEPSELTHILLRLTQLLEAMSGHLNQLKLNQVSAD